MDAASMIGERTCSIRPLPFAAAIFLLYNKFNQRPQNLNWSLSQQFFTPSD